MKKIQKGFLRSRTFIGIICIILAILIAFVICPLITNVTEAKTRVIRMKSTVETGGIITKDDIEFVNVNLNAVPKGAIKDTGDVLGKYAVCELYPGDYLFIQKLTKEKSSQALILKSLEEGKTALSLPAGTMAQSLSYKLRTGDIVSAYVFDEKTKEAYIPDELRYLFVIASTSSDGTDSGEEGFNGKLSAVTFLVNDRQAEQLIKYSEENSVYYVLRFRGDEAKALEYAAISFGEA